MGNKLFGQEFSDDYSVTEFDHREIKITQLNRLSKAFILTTTNMVYVYTTY